MVRCYPADDSRQLFRLFPGHQSGKDQLRVEYGDRVVAVQVDLHSMDRSSEGVVRFLGPRQTSHQEPLRVDVGDIGRQVDTYVQRLVERELAGNDVLDAALPHLLIVHAERACAADARYAAVVGGIVFYHTSPITYRSTSALKTSIRQA